MTLKRNLPMYRTDKRDSPKIENDSSHRMRTAAPTAPRGEVFYVVQGKSFDDDSECCHRARGGNMGP